MIQINLKATCGVWFALVLYISGQDNSPSLDDRLQADTNARLREFSRNNDIGGPRRPISPEMNAIADQPDLLQNLRTEDLAKMTLDDPLLKWAYACVFLRSIGPLEQLEPPLDLVLADMRGRGEAVSPMLLKLISENQENLIEFCILGKVEHLGTVRIEPFLDYARTLLRERMKTMTGEAAGEAAGVIARHGTKEDEALFEEVIKVRPYVTYSLNKELNNLRARLDPQPTTSRSEQQKIVSSNAGNNVSSGAVPEDHSQNRDSASSQRKPWLIGGMMLVALVGIYLRMRKSKRGKVS